MSAKELLARYSEFLNQTSLDPKFDPSMETIPVDSDPNINLPSAQVVDQLLPIIGLFIYLGLRLLGSVLAWVNRWRLFRRFKKTGTLHSIYYTMISSTVSGNFSKINCFIWEINIVKKVLHVRSYIPFEIFKKVIQCVHIYIKMVTLPIKKLKYMYILFLDALDSSDLSEPHGEDPENPPNQNLESTRR